MASIPIRHHYISKFLLRPLCYEEGLLHYCSKYDFSVSNKRIEEVFMVRNLYRDEINNDDDPTKIEKDLARFESEVSKIISKFRTGNDITITVEEADALKLFFAIMGFRSKRASGDFSENANDEFKEFYSFYQENGDMTDFWKHNLELIVNCRSIQEVLRNNNIAKPIKLFMLRDTEGVTGMHFVVAEGRGNEEFIMGDNLPACMYGSTNDGLELPMYFYIPLSPERALFLFADGVEVAPEKVVGFRRDFFKYPKYSKDGKTICHHVGRIYEPDVKKLNELMCDLSSEGFVFKNKDRVSMKNLEELYGDFKIQK